VLFGRRLRLGIAVLGAQLLSVAMATAWCIQLALIAAHGEVCFQETNPVILYGELALTALVGVFAAVVFVVQWKRLFERRANDSRQQDHEPRDVHK
jgi:membrane protein implicated in regulation of membrane protease activity